MLCFGVHLSGDTRELIETAVTACKNNLIEKPPMEIETML